MTALADHGKLIWNTMMSLDGFVADAEEAMDWVFGFDNTAGSSVPDLVDRLGALLVGRRTMDVEDRNQPGFYGGAYTGPFFVLTRDTDRAEPVVNGVTGTVLNGPIDDAVHKALEAAAGGDVAILGSTVARACLDANLVDEIIVYVAPILLGGGVPLYEGARRRLDLVDTRVDGEITTLTFVPRRNGHVDKQPHHAS